MQSHNTKQIILQEEKEITLYSLDGEVISVKEFVRKNQDVLSGGERKFLEEEMINYTEKMCKIKTPFSRTADFFNGKKTIHAQRGGTRSAYIDGMKIKGCRPADATFPHWDIGRDFKLKVQAVPFGVLTRRNVIREILAYFFMKQHDIAPSSEPSSVFYYKPKGKDYNYALLQNITSDDRLEAFIDCSNLTVHDLIRLKKNGVSGGREVELKGIDKKAYIKKKVNLLIKFNFNGGFRGILNSNIGNDVIRDGVLHSICDFDTFTISPLPQAQEDIRCFTIIAFLELIKTSLPFVDFINKEKHLHRTLSDYYRRNSTLYRMYYNSFLEQAAYLGWNIDFVKNCVDDTFNTPLSFELLQELIPNSHTYKSFNYDSVYVPHN